MRLYAFLLVAVLTRELRQSTGKPIGMEDTIADVVSRVLEGSDREKTEAINVVLQLLAEIDLPSLCKSIGEDPAKMMYVDDVIARAVTERSVAPSWSLSGPENNEANVNFPGTDIATAPTLGLASDVEVIATEEPLQGGVMTEKAPKEDNAAAEPASQTNLTTAIKTTIEADFTSGLVVETEVTTEETEPDVIWTTTTTGEPDVTKATATSGEPDVTWTIATSGEPDVTWTIATSGEPDVTRTTATTGEPDVTRTTGTTGEPDLPRTTATTGEPEVTRTTGTTGEPDLPRTTATSGEPDVTRTTGTTGEPDVTWTTATSGEPDVTKTTATTGEPDLPWTTGTTGEQDVPRTTGTTGEPDVTRTTATTGEPEVTRTTGTTGEPDVTRTTGTTGESDLPRTTGTTGEQDAPRTTGTTGEQDVPRTTGTIGEQDVPRTTGTTGEQDVPRTTGTTGEQDVPRTTGTTGEPDVTAEAETRRETERPETEAATDPELNTTEQSPTQDDPTTTLEGFKPADGKPSAIAPSYGTSNVADDKDYIAKIKSLYDDYIGMSDYGSPVLFPPSLGYDYYNLGDNFIYDIAAAAASSKVEDLSRLEQPQHHGDDEILHFPDSILSLKSLASSINPDDDDDVVYIEESKSLKPKPVLLSDNFQREGDWSLGTQITSQGAKQPMSSEEFSTPSVSEDPQVSQNSSTGFVDDDDKATAVLPNASNIITEGTLSASKFTSQSAIMLHDRSENILNETLLSFYTNITKPPGEGLNGELSFSNSFATAVLNVSSPSPFSSYPIDRTISPEETASAPSMEEVDTTYGKITHQQLETSDVANSYAMNISDSYSDTEWEGTINVSRNDSIQEQVSEAAADVFPLLALNPDFNNAVAKDASEKNQTLALPASSFASATSSINTTSNFEADGNNTLASDTNLFTNVTEARKEIPMKNDTNVDNTTLPQFITDTTTPFNYISNFPSDNSTYKQFDDEENQIAEETSEPDDTSSEKESFRNHPPVLLTTQVALESDGNYATSENSFVNENTSPHSTTSSTTQTIFSTFHASPTTERTAETTADTSRWILDSQKPDSKGRQALSSLSRTLENHLGHMKEANQKRKSEAAISSEIFSRWSGQEVQDKWSLIGKKREGTLADEVANPASKTDDREPHRDVQYKFDPVSVEKEWGKLTDTRTYKPRWESKNEVRESRREPDTSDKTLVTDKSSTTVQNTVSFSDVQPDKTRTKGDTFPPVIRHYSPRTWSPFNPHFASPNLGSLWGLSPNFQHQDAPHHLVRQKINDLGSYPEFQFGRPSSWNPSGKPSDISYQVKNKPKVSSEVLKTLGVKQKTILSEETLPKFLHFNGYLCPGLFGYFGDVMDCRSFFICSWGVPYRFYCPSGTLWNPVESVCDWSRNVKCGKK